MVRKADEAESSCFVFYLGCLNGEKNNDIPLIFTGCSIAQNLLRDRQANVKKLNKKNRSVTSK